MSQGRILVVEDDPDISDLLRIYFESEGYSVALAGHGEEALAMCRYELPTVIVLDIMLPDMDGYEVTAHLRQNPKLDKVPIVALTANVLRGDREKSLEAGCDGYIQKPLDVDMLPSQVEAFLRQSR